MSYQFADACPSSAFHELSGTAGGGSLTIDEMLYGRYGNGVEAVEFADGTVWDIEP